MEDQAQDLAKADFQKYWTHCGDAWFSHHTAPEKTFWSTDQFDYVEQRGVDIRVVSNDISEADRMNGFQWSGQVIFSGTVYRLHFPPGLSKPLMESAPPKPGWSDWINGRWAIPMYSLTKQNGNWKIDDPLGTPKFGQPPLQLSAVSCDQVPK